MNFELNGTAVDLEVDESTPLLWVLRDSLGMTGTKFGCGLAQCGACTVHLDKVPIRSCVAPISAVKARKVTTIEKIGEEQIGSAIQTAWVAHDVPQCGYCQSGQVMSATALLIKIPKPSDSDIDAAMAGNICRCGTYSRIKAAIKSASQELALQSNQAGSSDIKPGII